MRASRSAIQLALAALAAMTLACASSPPARAPAPTTPPAEKLAPASSTTSASHADPLADCELRGDGFSCDRLDGALARDAEGSVLEVSERLRADVDKDGAARFFHAPLGLRGRVDAFRYERGSARGLVVAARRDGRTVTATCRHERGADGDARCLAIARHVLGDDGVLARADDADADGADVKLDELKVTDEDGEARALSVEQAVETYGSGCDVEGKPGMHMIDCDEEFLAIFVGAGAPGEATADAFLEHMRKDAPGGAKLSLSDATVETARGTARGRRFVGEGDKASDNVTGYVVSEGLGEDLRFLLCAWKTGNGLEGRCKSLLGAMLR
jgi:hypothetical protein